MAKKDGDRLLHRLHYLSQNDKKFVLRSLEFATAAHKGQKRISGQPYIEHSLDVALKISALKLDKDAIAASLLHDTVEDTPTILGDIRKNFGPAVAQLVDGLTKLDRVRISKSWFKPFKKNYKQVDRYENQIETLRKMFVAMSRDIRVIIIKLADRLCNLRSLSYLPQVKQKRIAQETMDIYAPIANRLGMGEFRCELEDLSFPYLRPEEYKWVRHLAVPAIYARKKYLGKISHKLYNAIAQYGINCKIIYRAKRWYALFRKLEIHGRDIDKIYDLVALRIIVPEIEDCYNVLGVIHSLWQPLTGRIKDYIALPKPNGYQSIHTTVLADRGVIVEMQIRTPEMNSQAEFGIAAHWHYSDKRSSRPIPKKMLRWVDELLKWQKRITDTKDWKQALSIDFFKDRIFVFTPAGEAKDLPAGATPVDFAYSVHTAVGNQCAGAKINGRISPLNKVLANGDIIEIIKDKKIKPSRDWLRFVKTEQARESISKILNIRPSAKI